MKKTIFSLILSVVVLGFTSCSKDLDKALVGTWNVTEIKSEPASGTSSSVYDAGSITFQNGGTGTYSLDYGWGASSGNFEWSATDNNATVAVNAGLLNVLTGQYTVLTNKPKEQVWQRAAANGDKQTYTLKK